MAEERLVGGTALRPGDRVRPVSPASTPTTASVADLIESLRHAGIGQVDRNLTHLIRSGTLDGVDGIALGTLDGVAGYTDRGRSSIDVMRDRLGGFGVPVLGGLDSGHDLGGPDGTPDQFAATLGAAAERDTDAGTLTVGPCVR